MVVSILVLCTGNSVRSIMAEAIFQHVAAGRVSAFSAGTNPSGRVHPAAFRQLRRRGLSVTGLRSKGWEEFSAPGAPKIDLVLALCPAAFHEMPHLPYPHLHCLWPMQDPTIAPSDQLDLAFHHLFHALSARIHGLLALPFETMSEDNLLAELKRIGG